MLNGRHKPGLLAILIAGVLPLKALANGFGLPDQDAFATARGEAFTATADNPSAIYYNPAGITQLEGNNYRSGAYGIYLDESYTPPNSTQTYHDEDHRAAIPQLFFTHTFKAVPLSLGLGVYSPFGGKVSWPQNTGFRSVATYGQLTYLTANPVIAYQLLPSLSIGGGAMFNYAKIDMEQGLRAASAPLVNYFRFTGRTTGISYNAGLRWQPIDQLAFGATFRSSVRMNMEGHTEFEQQPIIPQQQLEAQASFRFPYTVVGGISWRPTQKWNLEFDADYTDWSSFGTVQLNQSTPPVPIAIKQDVPINLDWRRSWMYEFGVTRYLGTNWQVSAGYMFDEGAVPDAYYTPLAGDMDRDFFSWGGGYQGKHLSLDLAYQFGYGPVHTVTGSTPSSTPALLSGQRADGSYRYVSHAVIASLGIRF